MYIFCPASTLSPWDRNSFSCLGHTRFHNLHGESQARLERNQSVYEYQKICLIKIFCYQCQAFICEIQKRSKWTEFSVNTIGTEHWRPWKTNGRNWLQWWASHYTEVSNKYGLILCWRHAPYFPLELTLQGYTELLYKSWIICQLSVAWEPWFGPTPSVPK